MKNIPTAPVIAGLVVGMAFVVIFSYSFAFEQVPRLPSKSPTLVLVYEGKEYVGVPGSYGWSNGRTAVNADVLVDLVSEEVIELKNGSAISFVSKDEYVTKQPDVLQVLAAETGQNFTYKGFDPAITLEQVIDHRDPDPGNNVFLVDLHDGQYVLNVHAGWSPEKNKLTGGVDYFFKIRIVTVRASESNIGEHRLTIAVNYVEGKSLGLRTASAIERGVIAEYPLLRNMIEEADNTKMEESIVIYRNISSNEAELLTKDERFWFVKTCLEIVCYDELSSLIDFGDDGSYLIRIFEGDDPFGKENDARTGAFEPENGVGEPIPVEASGNYTHANIQNEVD